MRQLMHLLARNKATAQRRFEVVNAADSTTIYLYDTIVATQADAEWFGGVAADAFVQALAAITAPTIHLRINSPGGDVFAARAMEQAIRGHSAKVLVHIDGLAASAASFLAMAGDEVEISKGGFFMIHKAWTVAMGNSADLQDTAALLEKVDASLVQTYADKTGGEASQIADWMAAETWLTASEAVQHGFADKIAESAPKNAAKWDLSAFADAPAQPAAEDETTDPVPDPAPDTANPDPEFPSAALRLRAEMLQRGL